MFKKAILGVMAFVLVSVQANAATGNTLAQAFKDLNYSLKVEWDQKDQGFYNAQKEKFAQKLAEARKGGVTQAEITSMALGQIKDKNLAKQIEGTLNLVKLGTMSETEANKLIMDAVAKTQSVGASWSSDGTVVMVIVVIAIVAGIVALAIATACKGDEVFNGTYTWTCTEYCDVDSWGDTYCYEECYDRPNYDCIVNGQVQ